MEKEIYINLDDFLDAIRKLSSPSWVSTERLILMSEIDKAIAESRRVEA